MSKILTLLILTLLLVGCRIVSLETNSYTQYLWNSETQQFENRSSQPKKWNLEFKKDYQLTIKNDLDSSLATIDLTSAVDTTINNQPAFYYNGYWENSPCRIIYYYQQEKLFLYNTLDTTDINKLTFKELLIFNIKKTTPKDEAN